MNYVILDLEWNQPVSQDRAIEGLAGEIIQFGAVKLDGEKRVADSFEAVVRPCRYTKMNRYVKKLTGIDEKMLAGGMTFPQALDAFHRWCGEDFALLTWGHDDGPLLKENARLHGLSTDWIAAPYNLQVLFNEQVTGENRQWSLASGLEKLGLAPDDAAHDALHDARSTAQIAARLDLDKGIAGYRDATSALLCADVLASAGFRGLADPAAALEGAVGEIPCPVCGRPLERGEWVEQNGEKRIAMAACPEHGRFFVRLKLWRTGKTFSARRTLCRPDEQIDAFYREKASRARQRAEKRCADGAAGEQAGEN